MINININQTIGSMYTTDKWHKRLVCTCGWHVAKGMLHHDCCPECGRDKGSIMDPIMDGWKVMTMRCEQLPLPKRWWRIWKETKLHWISQ